MLSQFQAYGLAITAPKFGIKMRPVLTACRSALYKGFNAAAELGDGNALALLAGRLLDRYDDASETYFDGCSTGGRQSLMEGEAIRSTMTAS